MAENILLYPSLTDNLLKKIRFQKTKYVFFYTDKDDQERELQDEPVEALSSKLIRSSSMTNGRFMTRWLILMIYSPISPMKNSRIEPIKKIPMSSGAVPALNRSQ